MTGDQKRAIFAYDHVKEVKKADRETQKEYRTLVQGLGPLLLRSGLVTALAFLQRRKKDAPANLLFKHLAKADIPGLRIEQPDEAADQRAHPEHRRGNDRVRIEQPDEAADQLCESARHLDLETTMLATRHLLKVVEWLKRAVEATLEEGD